jgi:hypothetical protein
MPAAATATTGKACAQRRPSLRWRAALCESHHVVDVCEDVPVLPKTLAEPGGYIIQSTWDVANSVRNELLDQGLDADVRPVPELMPLIRRHGVRPLELLLALGKTTSALPGLGTAGAAGVAGLTALRTASRWAIMRYLWAFSEYRPDLRLSALTDQVRFHQRTILSEHFGIALAADVVEQLVLDQPASVVDADAVSYDPVLGKAMQGLGAHKPDYFWYCHENERLSEVVVVEAKGTSSGSVRTTIRQLARGVEQVLVPTQIPGVPMRRIVVGARFRGSKICAYAVEVGDPDVSTRQQAVAVIRNREDLQSARTRQEASEDLTAYFVTVDPTQAAEEVLMEDLARLHTFAGLSATSDTFRSTPELIRGRVRQLEPVYAENTTFRCESTRIALDGQTLHVRTGVAEELLMPPEDLPGRNFARRREYYRQGRNGNGYRLVSGAAEARGQGLQVLTSPDGCLLSVSLE